MKSFSSWSGLPAAGRAHNLAHLNDLHHSLLSIPASQHVILCGDFNLPGRNIDLLSGIALDGSLTQLVQQPTHGENILDLLLTNSPDMVSQVEVVSDILGSDHDAVQFLVRFTRPALVRHNRTMYNFKKADFDHFRDLLSKISWHDCLLRSNIEEAKESLFTAADKCIPKVQLRRKKKTHWLPEETLWQIKKKKRRLNDQGSRLNSSAIEEPVTWPVGSPGRTITITSRKSLSSYIVTSGSCGGGSKTSGVEQLVSPTLNT